MWSDNQERFYGATKAEMARAIAMKDLGMKRDAGPEVVTTAQDMRKWFAGGLMKNRPIYATEPPQVFGDYRVSRGSDGWHVSGPEGFYKHFHLHQRLHAELFAAALNLNLDEVGRIGRELRGIA